MTHRIPQTSCSEAPQTSCARSAPTVVTAPPELELLDEELELLEEELELELALLESVSETRPLLLLLLVEAELLSLTELVVEPEVLRVAVLLLPTVADPLEAATELVLSVDVVPPLEAAAAAADAEIDALVAAEDPCPPLEPTAPTEAVLPSLCAAAPPQPSEDTASEASTRDPRSVMGISPSATLRAALQT